MGALAQDAPRDASAAYLASLLSTQLVLTALQRACAARNHIQANLPCVKVDTVWLHKDRPLPRPGCQWALQTFVSVAFSPCQSWLAVVVEGEQVDPEEETESSS